MRRYHILPPTPAEPDPRYYQGSALDAGAVNPQASTAHGMPRTRLGRLGFSEMRHVGRLQEAEASQRLDGIPRHPTVEELFFSPEIVQAISTKLHERLEDVRAYTDGRRIRVPDEHLISAMDGVFQSYTPPVRDPHSREQVVGGRTIDGPEHILEQLVLVTVQTIYTQIRDHYLTSHTNRNLSGWDTVLGEHNRRGLQSFSQGSIKLKNRRPAYQFFSNF